MDGVSGAASFIAIVGMALTSIKIIHETICKVRDGPRIIVLTASALESLQAMLERVRAISTRLTSSNTDLQGVTQRCATGLKAFEEKIGCLRILPTDNISGKAWKRVKTLLKQDDFQHMWETINQQIRALSLGLQLVGLDTDFGFKESLHQLNEAQNVIIRNTSAASRKNVQNQLEKIMTLTSQQVLNSSTTTEIVSRSEATLGRIKEGVEGFSKESASLHASTRQDIEGLSTRMEKLSNLSEDQSEQIKSVLEQLQYLVNAEAKQKSQDFEAHERPTTSTDDRKGRPFNEDLMREHDELKLSLERLFALAAAKERTLFSREAQDIIEDVELLLNAVSSTREIHGRDGGKKRRRSQDCDSDSNVSNNEVFQYKRGIKRIKGILATSQCIMVNPKATPRRMGVLGRKYRTRCLHHSRRVDNGTIGVRASSRLLEGIVDVADARDDCDHSETIEVFEGVLTFLPNKIPNTSFSISFQQRSTFEGSLLGKPRISFSATLPNDSEVFLRIEDGDLEGLLKMLAEGAAALTDRDARGRSLLNYACSFRTPTICKYLVEHSADVDAVESDRYGFPRTMLNVWPVNGFEALSEGLDTSIVCRRVLLEAGADPTAYHEYEENAAFWSSLRYGTVESLRQILDLGREFIDLEEKDQEGCTALLRVLDGDCDRYRRISKMVELLLSRGANPQSTSNKGLSCLHYCIQNLVESECSETLVLLMKAGADPWAVDNSGLGVTEYAYDTPIEGLSSYLLSKESHRRNRGMIWEQALTACGYDAAEFRQSYLDAGERLDYVGFWYKTGEPYLSDSEYEGESNVSYETDPEEPTHSDFEKGWVASSAYGKERLDRETKDLISDSAADRKHVNLPRLGEYTHHRAAGNINSRISPSTQALEGTRYWRDISLEGIPIAEYSNFQFRNPSASVSTQYNSFPMAESSDIRFQYPSGVESTQLNKFPMMDTYPTNTSSWHGSYPRQFDNESQHANTWTQYNYHMPQPQTGDAYWSHTFAPHQSVTPQLNTLPRLQELDLPEGDADVQIPHNHKDYVPWDYPSMPHQTETPQPNTLPRIRELDLLEGDADVWGS